MTTQPFRISRFWESRWFQRFWDWFGAASIRVKVLGIVLGVIVLLAFFVTIQLRAALYSTLEDELHHQGIGISDSITDIVEARLEAGDLDALQTFLHEMQVHYSEGGHNTLVDYIFVKAVDGEIIVQSDDQTLVDMVINPTAAEILPRIRHLQTPMGHTVDVTTPILDGDMVMRIGLAEDNIEAITDTVTLHIISITLVMIVVGFAAAFFLTWILTRPILSLVEATQQVAKGDFSRQVARWANDEIGDLAEAFNAMTRSLASAERERKEREQMRENYIRGVIKAQEEERKRIARELHDSTSQSLTSLLVGLRNLESTDDLEQVHARIDDIRKVVNGTLEEVHALAWQLRPTVLDDLGLSAALQRYIADYERRFDIQVDFAALGLDERLPVEVETSLYRIIQESLTNILRHARAKNASILLEQRPQSIRVIIEDNGVGFDPEAKSASPSSLGLQGIRERAQLFGGRLTIESQPGQGTSLFVEIPLNGAQREGERN